MRPFCLSNLGVGVGGGFFFRSVGLVLLAPYFSYVLCLCVYSFRSPLATWTVYSCLTVFRGVPRAPRGGLFAALSSYSIIALIRFILLPVTLPHYKSNPSNALARWGMFSILCFALPGVVGRAFVLYFLLGLLGLVVSVCFTLSMLAFIGRWWLSTPPPIFP